MICKNAEAQAREAKIEAALERTRTQSMIMQHSKELDDTLRVFHEQVLLLGINSAFSFLWLPDEDKNRHIFWAAWAENLSAKQPVKNGSTVFKSKAINYPLDRNEPATAQCLVDWKSDEPIHSYHVPPAEVENYFAAWKELLDGVEKLKPGYFPGGLYYVEAFMKYGCFGVMVESELSEDEKKILGRFSVEFERTYTRFLDLQKAEVQAREAEIELALERVRARTMAMQKSDELKEVIVTVFEKLQDVGVVMHHRTALIIEFEKESKDFTQWIATPHYKEAIGYKTPYIDHPVLSDFFNARVNKIPFFQKKYTAEERDSLFRYFFEHRGTPTPEAEKQVIFEGEHYSLSSAFENNSAIAIASFSEELLSEKESEILIRFAKVFDQSYTRFLDLQKAEAQAREAKIEAALERVRARTMAMQKSEELKEVIQLVYEQFVQLNIFIEHTGFIIDYKARDDMHIWLADKHEVPFQVTIPYFDCAHWNSFNEAKEKGMDFFANHLSFEEKNRFYQDLFKLIPGLPEEAKEYYFSCPGLAISTVLLENVGLYIENFSGIPYSDEENATLMRFGKVFQQTYTRFLDLQKAEAQAREAQIEAALERVRSRTMAMHKSEELIEVIASVFQQLEQLSFRIDSANLFLNYKENPFKFWMAVPGYLYPSEIDVPYGDFALMNLFIREIKSNATLVTAKFNQEEKNEWVRHLIQHSIVGNASDEKKKHMFEAPGLAMSVAGVKNIALAITNYSVQSYSDEENEILRRFVIVFDQTYTRFLDLQKAEAQAREAQIEAALERVRSRTTGMQKSEELREVIQMVFEQLRHLDFNIDSAHFNLNYKESDDYNLWSAAPGQPYPVKTYIPYFDHPVFITARQAKEKGLDFFTESYTQDEKNKFFEHLFKHTPVIPEERRKYILSGRGIAASTVLMNTISLWIMNYAGIPYSEAENAILKRFGKIFEQSHTRFLDLQKAEAQAREATIEAALERVRARTMAMQKSEELSEVAALLFKQVSDLGIKIWSTGFKVWSDDNNFCTDYVTNPQGGFMEPYTIGSTHYLVFVEVSNAKKRGDEFFVYYEEGDTTRRNLPATKQVWRKTI